jgi:hypothetical protein
MKVNLGFGATDGGDLEIPELQCFADDMTVLMEETINIHVRLKCIFTGYKKPIWT